MRNVLGSRAVKRAERRCIGGEAIFASAARKEAERRRDEFVETFAKRAPKLVACIEHAFEDTLAVLALPEKYRRRLPATNMQERLDEEIRRRERVIRILPNEASALRMVGALLAETSNDWQDRAYFDMNAYNEWRLSLDAASTQPRIKRAA